ncbi:MAG: deiodinase, partial [Armatimonadetes bacterium]|nr:deiodinase [Armatimonadota bacterium]
LDQRRTVAGACVKTLGIRFPALVDTLDDQVEREYAGWPDRLYVVGQDGKIAYRGEPGPRGFRVEEVAAFLRTQFPE